MSTGHTTRASLQLELLAYLMRDTARVIGSNGADAYVGELLTAGAKEIDRLRKALRQIADRGDHCSEIADEALSDDPNP